MTQETDGMVQRIQRWGMRTRTAWTHHWRRPVLGLLAAIAVGASIAATLPYTPSWAQLALLAVGALAAGIGTAISQTTSGRERSTTHWAGLEISNLPPRNRHFTGRGELLVALEQSLKEERTTAVVATYGLGGIGKTQLVLEYIYRHLQEYDLVWWVPADSSLLVASGVAALAPQLGLAVVPDQDEQIRAVLAELASRERWMMVFDNATEPSVIGRYRPGGTGHVVITSRNPAWSEIANPISVDVMSHDEAVEFLLKRSKLSAKVDSQTAAVIAEELGRLPLALEQAAVYMEQTQLSLVEYLRRYRRYHAELLDRGVPANYPTTVATTWRLNIEQLAGVPAARQLLQLCAFLAPEAIPLDLLTGNSQEGVLPSELANAAGDELMRDDVVSTLYRYSLAVREGNGLRIHRLVQDVVRHELPSSEANVVTEQAIRLVHVAFPRSANPDNWPRCVALLPHAEVIVKHARERHIAPDVTAELLDRVGNYLRMRAEFNRARQYLEDALDLKEATFGPEDASVAKTLLFLATTVMDQGDLTDSRQLLERAAAIHEARMGNATDDAHKMSYEMELAEVLVPLGTILADLGYAEEGRAKLERALSIREAALAEFGPGSSKGLMLSSLLGLDVKKLNEIPVAHTLQRLGFVLQLLGDLHAAREKEERALAIFESNYGSSDPDVAIGHVGLAVVLHDLGELSDAKQHLERALTIQETVYGSDHPVLAGTLDNIGLVLRDLGDLHGAREHFLRALAILDKVHPPERPSPWVAISLHHCGLVVADLGDLRGAREYQKRALAIFNSTVGPDNYKTQRVLNMLNYPSRR